MVAKKIAVKMIIMNEYKHGIQLLRFFSSTAVVLAHIAHYIEVYYPFQIIDIAYLEHWGVYGVDIFFIISGYLMVSIQIGKSKSPLKFFADRLLRVAPLYWFLTIIYSFGLVVISEHIKSIVKFTIEHFYCSMMFISGLYLDKAPLLTVGWSLEYEVIFYILFSISIFIFKNLFYSSICTAFFIIMLFSFAGGPWHVGTEFVFGLFLGLNKINISYIWGVFILAIGSRIFDIDVHRAIIVGVPSAILVYYFTKLNVKKTYLSSLGNISYEVYLVQVFTLPILFKISYYIYPSIQSISAFIIILYIMVVLSGLLLNLSYSRVVDTMKF
ncbi:MAG: acyltransferase [Magnetococcales bacterium]|nr:acyltransferase [Magnetococcales bacterium]